MIVILKDLSGQLAEDFENKGLTSEKNTVARGWRLNLLDLAPLLDEALAGLKPGPTLQGTGARGCVRRAEEDGGCEPQGRAAGRAAGCGEQIMAYVTGRGTRCQVVNYERLITSI